ncbi:hypothetical protein TSOC_010432, partial [Tetrabaena socialis]
MTTAPFSTSHSSCSSLPPSTAAAKAVASHGQPRSRSQPSSSMLPARAAAANTLVVRAAPAPILSTSQATAG